MKKKKIVYLIKRDGDGNDDYWMVYETIKEAIEDSEAGEKIFSAELKPVGIAFKGVKEE